MANLKLVLITGKPFADYKGSIAIQRDTDFFHVINNGRLVEQRSSKKNDGYRPATEAEIKDNWDSIHPHWIPEKGDKVIITQDLDSWIGVTCFIDEKTTVNYYSITSPDGRTEIFTKTQMILAPFQENEHEQSLVSDLKLELVSETNEKNESSVNNNTDVKFNIGNTVKIISEHQIRFEQIGKIICIASGAFGVQFDTYNKYGYHLHNRCELGYGDWFYGDQLILVNTPVKPDIVNSNMELNNISTLPARRFRIGDEVTFKSRKECGGKYHYGGFEHNGLIGTVTKELEYINDNSCYGIIVTCIEGGDYRMLESEFLEFDSIGKSKESDLTYSVALNEKRFVGDSTYRVSNTEYKTDSISLSDYEQKPIIIGKKQKSKIKVVTI